MTDRLAPERSSPTVEAADWYARLRSGNVCEVDAVRFRAWVAADPSHRREFDELDALWERIGAIEQSPEVLRERAQPIRSEAAPQTREASAKAINHRPRIALLALAASLLLIVIVGASLYLRPGSNDYATGVGEQRVFPLDDGSVVTLNTSSRLRLDYSTSQRTIELLSGQANFEVAKDPHRPFIVKAGSGEVRAIGTVFDVYRMGDKVTVTLIEGKVAILPNPISTFTGKVSPVSIASSSDEAQKSSESQGERPTAGLSNEETRPVLTLTPGQQLSYGGSEAVVARQADVRRVSAWRTRKLEFDDTPLTEAIAEANRYSKVAIELRAPKFATTLITGTFEAGKNELFAEALESYFGLRVVHVGDKRIVLEGQE